MDISDDEDVLAGLPSPGAATVAKLVAMVPSPVLSAPPTPAVGATHEAPIVISLGSSGPVELPQDAMHAWVMALDAAARSGHVSLTPPPLSRRPSLMFATQVDAPPPDGGSSDSSSTPTATPSQSDFDCPAEWGSHMPSVHSSVGRDPGTHPRVPIVLDTPMESSIPTTASTDHAPPVDMGCVRRSGKMSSARIAVAPSSSLDIVVSWESSQLRDALAVLQVAVAQQHAPPAPVEVDPAPAEADALRIDLTGMLHPQMLGYSYYLQTDPILPIAGSAALASQQSVDNAFQVVNNALSLGLGSGTHQQCILYPTNWFRGTMLLLAAMVSCAPSERPPLLPAFCGWRGSPVAASTLGVSKARRAQCSAGSGAAVGGGRRPTWCDEFVTTTHGMAIDDAVTSLITMLQVADQEDLSAHALTCIAIACVAWEPDHKHHIAEQKAAWMAEVAEQQRTAAIQEGE
ncbi:hypothetical protein H4582DRAFT_2065098 [Lactarius indigo]|nr:hypothetical protein H4582DRAFT_2065098 [Lactarius indigo]